MMRGSSVYWLLAGFSLVTGAPACGGEPTGAPNAGTGANGGSGNAPGKGGTGGSTSGSAGKGGTAGQGTGGASGATSAGGTAGQGTGGTASPMAGTSSMMGGSGGMSGAGTGGGGTAGMQAMSGNGGAAGMGSGGASGSAGNAPGGQGGRANGGAPGAGMAGMSGASGAAGSPMVGDCPAPTTPIGWASVSGDGVTATTGGLGGDTVKPTTADELIDYAASDEPLIIQIEGTFDVPRLNVSSNKTLIGIGDDATLNGGVRMRGYDDDNVQNVILRNLHVNGGTSDADNDAMQIYFAHHVWVDHCDIYDGPDGNLDITHASSWVTVSWTKFRYTDAYQTPSGEDSAHRFSNLLGHSDNNSDEDTGRLKISFHHNYWGEKVIERMPRVRFGQVHVFNNYFNAPDNNYCVGGGLEAQLLVENNYFDDVKDPHRFQDDDDTAQIVARNNTYIGKADTTAKDTRGTAFTPGYTAALEAADATLKATVQKCAGPH
jgi:pectate lyase